MSEDRTVVGLESWLPAFLRRPWWTEPVPAERLAALRIGTALVLLVDILVTSWPYAALLFSADGYAAPEISRHQRGAAFAPWSVLSGSASPAAWTAIFITWTGAAVLLLVGVYPRVAAAVCWFLTVNVANVNPYVLNSGDQARAILLFYLILTPCGAVWSLWPRRVSPGPIFVHPWAVRLLFIQLAVAYFLSGATKLISRQWLQGDTLYYAMASIDWTHVSYASLPLPSWLMRGLTWFTLLWEIGFPVLAVWPATRTATLWIGVLFHLGTSAVLRIGLFGPYMICFYLPLVPWEKTMQNGECRMQKEDAGPVKREPEV